MSDLEQRLEANNWFFLDNIDISDENLDQYSVVSLS
jgi:hypothetical protein